MAKAGRKLKLMLPIHHLDYFNIEQLRIWSSSEPEDMEDEPATSAVEKSCGDVLVEEDIIEAAAGLDDGDPHVMRVSLSTPVHDLLKIDYQKLTLNTMVS